MTPSEIQIEIQTYLETLMQNTNFSGVTLHTYEGVYLQTEPKNDTDTWVLFSIRLIDTIAVEIGRQEAIGIRNGNLHVNIFTPIDNGTIAGYDLASLFEGYLRKLNLSNCSFQEPNTTFITTKDAYNHHIVIPFYTTIGE